MNQTVELIVPRRYKDFNNPGTAVFTLPVYNQDYTVSMSFPKTSEGSDSLTGVKFPLFAIAIQSLPIIHYHFKWSGLTEGEKDQFVLFLESFNNSFQPFTLNHYQGNVVKRTVTGIIEQDTVEISRDKHDLYEVSFTITQ